VCEVIEEERHEDVLKDVVPHDERGGDVVRAVEGRPHHRVHHVDDAVVTDHVRLASRHRSRRVVDQDILLRKW